MKIAAIMGSKSDYTTMEETCKLLEEFEIPFDKKVVSAHRTPDLLVEFSKNAKSNGYSLIIAAAGGAAHLPGMVASMTTLPVIGVPIKSSVLSGVDSLYSIVQMPAGVPVLTMAIGVAGAKNAAISALSILGITNEKYADKYERFKKEQERIVERFGFIETFIQLYRINETKLLTLNNSFPESFKKSILQEAIQGKLVPQDENDEPASVLLERIRAEKQKLIAEGKIKKDKNESVIFRRDNSHYEKRGSEVVCIDDEIPFKLPDNWCWVRWGNIAESIQYGYNAPAKDNGRIRMVRISDIQNNDVNWDSIPYCDIPESDISAYLLRENDILFTRTGGTVGKSYLVGSVPNEAIYAGYLIRTRYSKELCPQYLKYFMESPLYWEQLKSGTTATAQPNCNGQTLSKMLFPLPPVKEQFRIVDILNSLVTKTDELAL